MLPPRTRKFIGTVLFVTYLIGYSLVAMAMGARYLSDSGGLSQFVFYAIAGLAWLPIAMIIISWMAKADKHTS